MVSKRSELKQMITAVTRLNAATSIGARLRRLSERIDQDCARIYTEHGIRFEQRWFGVMYQLAKEGSLSVGQLAANIGISHASVSQTRKSLQAAGLILSKPAPEDARIAHISLSAKGKALLAKFSPLWLVLGAVSDEINSEAGEILDALDHLDRALNRQSLYDRVQARLKK